MPVLFEAPAKGVKPTHKPVGIKAKHTHAMGPFTAYAVSPAGVRFETQEAEEEVILFLRQHLIVNIPWIIVSVVFLLTPSFLFPLIVKSIPVPLPFPYILVGTLSWYLMTIGFALVSFLHWFFNIYIVTNERVIDVDFQYLLFKRFSQAELERIQDISYTMGGIFATIFHYGNVYIQTAGEMPNLEFVAVPRPDKVVEKVRSLMEDLPGSI